MTDVFAALADPNRRHLLEALARREASATQLAAGLPVTRQAVAEHLAALRDAGLVESRRAGRETIYSLNAGPLEDAVTWIVRVGGEWEERLERLRGLLRSRRAVSCCSCAARRRAAARRAGRLVGAGDTGAARRAARGRSSVATAGRSVTTAYGYPGWIEPLDALSEEPGGDWLPAGPRRRSRRGGTRLPRHAVSLGRDERARHRLLRTRPHGVAPARAARAARRRPAGGGGA